MGVLAAFLLVVALIVLAILGVGLYMLAMWLRRRQLNPEEDKIEGRGEPGRGGDEPGPGDEERGPDGEPERQERPEHVVHGNSQRARFIGTR